MTIMVLTVFWIKWTPDGPVCSGRWASSSYENQDSPIYLEYTCSFRLMADIPIFLERPWRHIYFHFLCNEWFCVPEKSNYTYEKKNKHIIRCKTFFNLVHEKNGFLNSKRALNFIEKLNFDISPNFLTVLLNQFCKSYSWIKSVLWRLSLITFPI